MLDLIPEFRPTALPGPPEPALREGADRVLAERSGSGIWVFAYGALLWQHPKQYDVMHPGRVQGLTRRYCLRDERNRGTPEHRSLTLGLVPGDEPCDGAAMHLLEAGLAETFWAVWQQEMAAGAYRARWVQVGTAHGTLDAVTFVADPDHPLYAGILPDEEVARTLAATSGSGGTAASYLAKTVGALQGLGLHDAHLEGLQARVTTLLG